ncbi:unnamed protein product [Spirodela intermedia]|uniref:Uncharacterized protein n=1 Tax=Spirodela intermedia TaxID=51605 RepID=A0A7I8IEX2_SPIIN|nr:unnamed protein product [Spirodela intermedia]CAA6656336.1 unnamed protein product [Spirodela intermedia]
MLETVKYLLGYAGPSGYGSKTTAEEVTAACPDLSSVTAIITGATSGIGAETARVLAMRGAHLVLPARCLKAAEETRGRIIAQFPGAKVIVLPLDLSSQASVRDFVSRFESLHLPLHLLINNAGRFSHGHDISVDGVEMTFATNYLGHYLLTKLLLEKMAESARASGIQGRIVNVTSNIHEDQPIRPDAAYTLSKLANVLHTRELAERLKKMGANVTANCVHPGSSGRGSPETRGLLYSCLIPIPSSAVSDLAFFLASKLLKTIPQAAATTCYVAVHPRVARASGKYYVDCNEATLEKLATDAREAARLWLVSEALISAPPATAAGDALSYRCRLSSSDMPL